MIDLNSICFNGKPGVWLELRNKITRLNFEDHWALNSPASFYYIDTLKNIVIKSNERPNNRLLVSFEQFKELINAYTEERIASGDWWLNLKIGDEITITDFRDWPDFKAPGLEKYIGQSFSIIDITPNRYYNSTASKSKYFNGDNTGYDIKDIHCILPSMIFENPNNVNIEKIQLTSLSLEIESL